MCTNIKAKLCHSLFIALQNLPITLKKKKKRKKKSHIFPMAHKAIHAWSHPGLPPLPHAPPHSTSASCLASLLFLSKEAPVASLRHSIPGFPAGTPSPRLLSRCLPLIKVFVPWPPTENKTQACKALLLQSCFTFLHGREMFIGVCCLSPLEGKSHKSRAFALYILVSPKHKTVSATKQALKILLLN